MSENNAATKLTDDSDELIELAKLAEQAERYDDMKAVRTISGVCTCMSVCSRYVHAHVCIHSYIIYTRTNIMLCLRCLHVL